MKSWGRLSHLFVAVFLYNFATYLVFPAMTDVIVDAVCDGKDECSLSIYLSGSQQAIAGLGAVLMMPVIGKLSDVHGRKAILQIPFTLAIIPYVILAWKRSTNFFYAVKILTGMVTEGGVLCLSLGYLTMWLKGIRVSAFGVLSGVLSAANLSGTLIARLLSIPQIFQVALAASVVALVYMRLFLKEKTRKSSNPNPNPNPIEEEEEEAILNPTTTEKIDFIQEIPSPKDIIRLLRTSVTFSLLACVTFCDSLAEAGVQASLLYYLKARFHYKKNQIADILFITYGAATVSNLFFLPAVGPFIGEETLLIVAMFAGFLNMFFSSIAWSSWVLYASTSLSFFFSLATPNDLRTGETKGTGKLEKGLYFLERNFRNNEKQNICNSLICNRNNKNLVQNKCDLWHCRLGHLSFARLQWLPQLGIGKESVNNSVCPICPLAKQTRLKFPTSKTQTTQSFQLIHVDIWGPYKEPTYNQERYFLTIVDDYSRYCWVFLMKFKTEVVQLLTNFILYAENQFDSHIKIIRTANARDFFNSECDVLFKSKGIIHQSSCVYTPQQNGIVERKHRHILDVARALKFHSQVPIKFWGDCVLTAVYLINITPSPLLHGHTPHFKLYNSVPEYNHLRIFGCLCYVKILPNQDKFHEKSKACILVGYSNTQKGYKLLCLQDQTFCVARDVVFHEDSLPFVYQNKIHEDQFVTTDSDNLHNDFVAPFESDSENHVHSPTVTDQNETSDEIGVNLDTGTDVVPSSEPLPNPEHIRRSSRQSHPPIWAKDYYSPYISNSTVGCPTVHPISNFIGYDLVSPQYKFFLSAISNEAIPKTYKEASVLPQWQEAMSKEIHVLDINNTWSIVDLPAGKKPIGCRWVYAIKYHSDGSIDRYKARLVAKGFTQLEGVDYSETFAPVAKHVTIRIILSMAAKFKWSIFQMDVSNAFLQGDLAEEIYMDIPPGFGKHVVGKVCKLHKSLYGLKQAHRQWNLKFTEALHAYGFSQSKGDYSLFVKFRGSDILVLLVYVDDIIITGSCDSLISDCKSYLNKLFMMKDLGELKYFLGIEVARSAGGICINQRKYLLELLDDTGMLGCKPVGTPMDPHVKLTSHEYDVHVNASDSDPLLSDVHFYQKIVGKLLYLCLTRPDISHSVLILTQFMHQPKQSHLDAAFRVLRYLKGKPGLSLHFSTNSSMQISAYCDSDWASCPMTRRSITGYAVQIGDSLVSWKAKKQQVVSRSSAEAEYRAMSAVTCEVVWILSILKDLHLDHKGPVRVYSDSSSALQIGANPVFHERTKHIEVDCHFIRDKIQEGVISTHYIPTQQQPADLLTKSLRKEQAEQLLFKIGVINLFPSTSHLEGEC